MHTSPHFSIVVPTSAVKSDALPSAPWLRTTAGNGPAPGGLRRTPDRSYATPSTVPRNVQVAPLVDSGLPVTAKAPVVSPGLPTSEGAVCAPPAPARGEPTEKPMSAPRVRRTGRPYEVSATVMIVLLALADD